LQIQDFFTGVWFLAFHPFQIRSEKICLVQNLKFRHCSFQIIQMIDVFGQLINWSEDADIVAAEKFMGAQELRF
jgi:hypothetical protein